MSPRAAKQQPAPATEESTVVRWVPPGKLGRRGWLVLLGVVLLINLPVLHMLVRSEPRPKVTLPFADDFSDPATVSRSYRALGGDARVVNGQLLSPGTKNNPLWLSATLPNDVVVEVSARPINPDGEIRVVLFGSGLEAESGYQAVLGPWTPNGSPARVSTSLVRLDENGQTLSRWLAKARVPGDLRSAGFGPASGLRVEAASTTLDPNHVYRMRFERRGGVLRWTVDGTLIAELNDPFPLGGPGHDRLGLSSGEWDVYYDDLRVSPASSAPFAASAPPAPLAPEAAAGPFSDDFNRPELGADWLATDPAAVTLVDSSLVVKGAHNHPVWLRRPIPDDAVIDFDAWTDSPDGDVKVEVYGDGRSFYQGPPGGAYEATGYVLVMGGWRNSLSAIARRNEHANDRVVRSEPRVEPGRKYHWTIRRQGGTLSWSIDGQPFLTFEDPQPLRGLGQRFFAFSGWETPVHFARLRIQPL